MPKELILVDQAGKKFHRTLNGAFLHTLRATARRALRLRPQATLDKDEFWALRDVSFIVERGECLGVIGPNGAGKSTLLKLISREYRIDAGRILTLGSVKSLLRIDSGLQALLSGRENIGIFCHQLGLGKAETEAKLAETILFAGLGEAIDAPVKTYSDGMYARLEFSIATSVQSDILLVDEVLAVGDIAFQIRALDRINQLKQNGAAIIFVSHSEMNVRHVADRCLLLFNGRQIALGETDALFYKYYESVGYLNDRLQPLGDALQTVNDVCGLLTVKGLRAAGPEEGGLTARTGDSVDWILEFESQGEIEDVHLTLHFRNVAGMLVGSVDSSLVHSPFRLRAGKGEVRVRIPFVALTPGYYRVAGGFSVAGQWLAYDGCLSELYIVQHDKARHHGLMVMDAQFEVTRFSDTR
jgi:lipopolysaccharide transport system ATP-binding protein